MFSTFMEFVQSFIFCNTALHHLIEKRKTLIDGNDKTLVLVHIRSIDDKIYKEVIEADVPESQVESGMTKDEVKKFEEDWTNLWNPDISQKEIEKLHQMYFPWALTHSS